MTLIFLCMEATRPGLPNARSVAPRCLAAGLATALANRGLLNELGT